MKTNIKTKEKKKMTPYIKFCMEMRPVVKQELPELSPKDVTREIAKRWNMLKNGTNPKYKSKDILYSLFTTLFMFILFYSFASSSQTPLPVPAKIYELPYSYPISVPVKQIFNFSIRSILSEIFNFILHLRFV